MQSVSAIGRIAAVGAVIGAIVLVAFVLFSGSGGYQVRADFINASQLVEGNQVQVAGNGVGTVEKLEVTPDGQAAVILSIDDPEYAPLREGTTARIRQFSLSGIANRYVDLTLPTGDDDDNPEIPDGGVITAEQTDEPTEIDQIFNMLDPLARVAIQDFLRQSAVATRGRGEQLNRGYQYLNPALSASGRVFRELNRDSQTLEDFLVDSATLVTTLAERRDDLAALIGNLNQTTAALGNEQEALAEAIGRFPDFMRTANTTFVNLRTTLDTLDPLVEASEPVVSRPGPDNDLQELLPVLRAFTRDARPAVRDLDRTLRHPGPTNDVIDLQSTFPPLATTALDTRSRTVNPAAVPAEGNRSSFRGRPRSVGRVPGAFPETIDALDASAPIIAQGRPYTPDLFGWFDDFSHTGGYDALGGINRAEVIFNESSVVNDPGTTDVPNVAIGQIRKCPGGSEVPDSGNVFSLREQDQLACEEDARQAGDYEGNNDSGKYDRVGPAGGPFPSR